MGRNEPICVRMKGRTQEVKMFTDLNDDNKKGDIQVGKDMIILE